MIYIYFFLNNLRHNFRNKKLNYSPIILFFYFLFLLLLFYFLLLNKIRLNQHWQSSKVNIYYEMHNIDSLIKFVYTRMTSWMQLIFFSNCFSIIINISWFYILLQIAGHFNWKMIYFWNNTNILWNILHER